MAKKKKDTKTVKEYGSGVKEIVDIKLGEEKCDIFCLIFSKIPRKGATIFSRKLLKSVKREDLNQNGIEISELHLDRYDETPLIVYSGVRV